MNARLPIFLCFLLTVPLGNRGAHGAIPTGRLAYRHEGAVCVCAASGAGVAQTVPSSQGASAFSLSPRPEGTIVFFAPRQDKSNKADGNALATLEAFFSRPPYRVSRPLPIFLNKEDDATVSWTMDGKADIAIGDLKMRELDPASGQLTVVSEKLAAKAARRSYPGGVRAYCDDQNRIVVDSGTTGGERVLFSPAAPQALFAAFAKAHDPAKLKELADEIDPMLWKDSHNWSVSSPALTPDGKTVFFAANLGTGMGAQGNTEFCFFAAEVRTGKLSVLSKTGAFFGRTPNDSEVSPDGLRLAFATSAHNSAADNAFSAYIVDLPTQQTRELLHDAAVPKVDTNLIDGWRWSPDGRYLAIAVLYYDPTKIEATGDPDLGRCTLYLKDAATGRTVRQIPNAHQPAWSAL